jgi:hypothetical protein
MPVVTVLEFPGVTQELYEKAAARLAQSDAPAGILYHACGSTGDGWRIVDVWETAEVFDRFVDERYLPAMRAAGGSEPVRREVMQTHHAGPVKRE